MSDEELDPKARSRRKALEAAGALAAAMGGSALASCVTGVSPTAQALASTAGMDIAYASLVADLKGLTGGAGAEVAILGGYHTEGDGAGGVFEWDGSMTVDDGGTTHLAAGGGGWRRIYDDGLDVQWFGATGFNATENTSGIQRALDAAAASVLPNGNGVVVRVPPKVLEVNETLTLGNYAGLVGHGAASQLRFCLSDDANGIEIPNIGGGNRAWIQIRQLRIANTNCASRGAGVHVSLGTGMHLDECVFTGWRKGVHIRDGYNHVVSRCLFTANEGVDPAGSPPPAADQTIGVHFFSTPGGSSGSQMVVRNCRFAVNLSILNESEGRGTLVENCELSGVENFVVLRKGGTTVLRRNYFEAGGHQNAMVFVDGPISNLVIAENYFSANTSPPVKIADVATAYVDGFTFTDNQIQGDGGAGAAILGAGLVSGKGGIDGTVNIHGNYFADPVVPGSPLIDDEAGAALHGLITGAYHKNGANDVRRGFLGVNTTRPDAMVDVRSPEGAPERLSRFRTATTTLHERTQGAVDGGSSGARYTWGNEYWNPQGGDVAEITELRTVGPILSTSGFERRLLYALVLEDKTSYQLEVDTMMVQNQGGTRFASHRQLVTAAKYGSTVVRTGPTVVSSQESNIAGAWIAAAAAPSVSDPSVTGTGTVDFVVAPAPNGAAVYWTVRVRVVRVFSF